MEVAVRAARILLDPRQAFGVIATEGRGFWSMFAHYAIPISALPALAGFLGAALVAVLVDVTLPDALGSVLLQAAKTGLAAWLLGLLGVLLLGQLIALVAPYFGARRDGRAAMQLAIHAPTAAWVAGCFAILPPLQVLALLGLYSLYLLRVGGAVLLRVPADRLAGFTAVIGGVALLLDLGVRRLACTALP